MKKGCKRLQAGDGMCKEPEQQRAWHPQGSIQCPMFLKYREEETDTGEIKDIIVRGLIQSLTSHGNEIATYSSVRGSYRTVSAQKFLGHFYMFR